MNDMIDIPKGYDGIMIESKDNVVTKDSIVCISPFNTKTKRWLMGLMYITTMSDALKCRKKKVSKDKNVELFLSEYYKKRKR